MADRNLVHIAGIPGVGKSSFGRWLSQEHGYSHLDLENPSCPDQAELVQAIALCASTGQISVLVDRLCRVGDRVVLDWGFPVALLPVVQALRNAGVRAWWFDGDRERAREAYVKRGTVPIENFARQMMDIEASWTDIVGLYQDRTIQVLNADGRRLPFDDIWARVSL